MLCYTTVVDGNVSKIGYKKENKTFLIFTYKWYTIPLRPQKKVLLGCKYENETVLSFPSRVLY